MNSNQKEFIEKIYKSVAKYAPNYDIKVYSPIIAQAIIESKWGKSKLSSYNNFFGLKAGKGYKGETIVFETKEEIDGKVKTIKDTFRSYKNIDAGIKGYFDFINTTRYKNLKGVTDPETYLLNIKKDGYATASNYVAVVLGIVAGYNLTIYDPANQKEIVNDFDDSIKKCFDMIATDVIRHPSLYGNSEVRKERIYKEIQLRINKQFLKR